MIKSIEVNKKELRITDKYVSFWGSPFSNFYPCKIEWDGKQFKTSEHLFMYQKAILFNDNEIAEQILNVEHPRDARALGRKVKGFDSKIWDQKKELIMHTAVLQKFSQNKELKEFILSEEFLGKHFVEGSPEDRVWGVGIIFFSEEIDDKNNWHGENLLGQILDLVREEIIQSNKNI